jgi:hypothetical protein
VRFLVDFKIYGVFCCKSFSTVPLNIFVPFEPYCFLYLRWAPLNLVLRCLDLESERPVTQLIKPVGMGS